MIRCFAKTGRQYIEKFSMPYEAALTGNKSLFCEQKEHRNEKNRSLKAAPINLSYAFESNYSTTLNKRALRSCEVFSVLEDDACVETRN